MLQTFSNLDKFSEINKEFHVKSWLTYWSYSSVWWILSCTYNSTILLTNIMHDGRLIIPAKNRRRISPSEFFFYHFFFKVSFLQHEASFPSQGTTSSSLIFTARFDQNLHWKLGQQSAICWNSLGLLWDYGLDHVFLRIKLFCFSR